MQSEVEGAGAVIAARKRRDGLLSVIKKCDQTSPVKLQMFSYMQLRSDARQRGQEKK